MNKTEQVRCVPANESSEANIFLRILDGFLEMLWSVLSWTVRIIWNAGAFCAGILSGSLVRSFARKMDESAAFRRLVFALAALVLLFLWMPVSQYRGYWGPWKSYESGLASWYGSGFYFRRTASGDFFLPGPFYTAAHKMLPLGTWVKVLNNENGKWVVVKINDRGPFVKGRIIDLTHAAARRLGIADDGVAKVTLYLRELPPESPANIPSAVPSAPATEKSPVITPPEDVRVVVIEKKSEKAGNKTPEVPAPPIAAPKLVRAKDKP